MKSYKNPEQCLRVFVILIHMSIWAERRKQAIIWVIILLIFGVIGIAAWTVLHREPTCSDRQKNQNEQGIDCGGVCDLMCKDSVQEPVILWQRFFKVSDGIYTAGTMVQNPNLYSYAPDVPYRIRFYDSDGVTIFGREGYVTLYPKYNFPIINPGIRTLERVPVRMTFEFTAEPVWYRAEEQENTLSTLNDVVYNETTSPRIDAIIRNDSNLDKKGVKVVALVYDPEGNVMAVSQTVVGNVPAHGSSKVVFSWPEPFPSPILKKELIILPY
jgi:hypothetical protein